MAHQTPPIMPPLVAVSEDDGLNRLRFRLWQIFVTTLTVFGTAWCCTLGVVPAILALAVAKHVLVAILVMGLDIYPQYKGERGVRPWG